MKIFHALIAALLLAGNLAAQDVAPLRIVFWNLEWFPGGRPNATLNEAENQIAMAVPATAALAPDILGMEEIRDWDAAETVIKGIPGMRVQVSSDFIDEAGTKTTQQVVIASRLPAIGGWWEPWKAGRTTPSRGFSFAAYQPAPDQVLLVYCVHLKSNRGELSENVAMREESARQLVSHAAAMEKAYGGLGEVGIVIGGDYNTSSDDPRFGSEQTFKILEAAGFQSAWKDVPFARRVTLPSAPRRNSKSPPFPDACFDHVFVKNARVVSASAEKPEPNPSDHRPVLVRIARPAR
jgi:endonuclease/exonuclease/phosphatase (EEP) superfamily protein YafD